MNALYSGLFYLATPFLLARLWWRGQGNPAYRQRWRERLAWYALPCVPRDAPLFWCHAVSVGEAEALFPLVRRLRERYPPLRFLITTTTPTSSARVQAVWGENVQHVYLPYDMPDAVARFLDQFQPTLAVVMETELWPNLFQACARRKLPLFLINARLSERSCRGYRRLPALTSATLASVTAIAAQTADDAVRFAALGVVPEKIHVLGNLKFDLTLREDWRERGHELRSALYPNRLVWIAASTHAGEEELCIACYRQLKPRFPALLLVVVPRHPERFAAVRSLFTQAGLRVAARSAGETCRADTDVYLGDTMGELRALYATSDVAVVGGSFVAKGGHNVLEPAAMARPVIFGQDMTNFRDIAQGLLMAQAAVQCDRALLADELARLFEDTVRRETLGQAAARYVAQNRGTLERVVALLAPYCESVIAEY